MVNKNSNLIFREFNSGDYLLVEKIFTDPDVMSYALEDIYTEEQVRDYFEKILENNSLKENRPSYEFAIFLEDKYMGIADIVLCRKEASGGVAEIGYFLLPEFWGRGWGTHVVAFLIGFAFDELGLHKVFGKCNANNVGSRRVMEKNQMVLEGYFKLQRFKGGRWEDECVLSRLKEKP